MTEQQLAWKGAKALLHRHGGAKAEMKLSRLFCADPPRARGASMTEQQLARKGAKALLRKLSIDVGTLGIEPGPNGKKLSGPEKCFSAESTRVL